MNPEDIAARFDEREGFGLIDYAEVGLPLYRVHAIAVLLAKKTLSPIEEFVVRAMGEGIVDVGNISSFLGLDREIIEGTLSNLIRSELVYQRADQVIQLTSKGRLAVSSSTAIRPVENMVSFVVDGLTRKPTVMTDVPVYLPSELKREGIRLVRAFPARKPDIDELDLNDVEDALIWGERDISRGQSKLLRIRRIVRANRIYLRSIALIYRAESREEIQVGFAIDGRGSEEHELAFLRAKGPERLGIVKEVMNSSHSDLKDGRDTDISPVARSKEVEIKRIKRTLATTKFRAEVAEKRRRESTVEAERKQLIEKRDVAIEKAQTLEERLNDMPVRPIAVYEHPQLLRTALESTVTRLLIISPWINGVVVNAKFLDHLRRLLKAGVDVYIGYGLDDRNREKAGRGDNPAERALNKLAEENLNFRFRRLGDTHAKVLIKDSDYYVITSFNWLSFRGDPNRTFREEWGNRVSIAEIVDDYFQKLSERFQV